MASRAFSNCGAAALWQTSKLFRGGVSGAAPSLQVKRAWRQIGPPRRKLGSAAGWYGTIGFLLWPGGASLEPLRRLPVPTPRSLIAGIVLSAVLSPAAFADDLSFILVNRSSSDLKEFYASPTGVDDWEEDILGVDVLTSGDRVKITIADGRRKCRYDLKFVFDDGGELEDRKVDLCRMDRYTLKDK